MVLLSFALLKRCTDYSSTCAPGVGVTRRRCPLAQNGRDHFTERFPRTVWSSAGSSTVLAHKPIASATFGIERPARQIAPGSYHLLAWSGARLKIASFVGGIA